MLKMLSKNWDKTKLGLIFFLFLLGFVVISFTFKNEKTIEQTYQKSSNYTDSESIKLIKDFFLKKIKSPFTNINYEIKKGDTIGKILKKLNIKNSEIQKIINEYNK